MGTMETVIYTDGCCLKNPGGAGGCAYLILRDGKLVSASCRGFKATTSNRMEIMAAIAGADSLKERSRGIIYSDSQYLVRAIENGWLRKWKRNGWILRTGEGVKNRDLWEQLDKLLTVHNLRLVWIRGHNGDVHNERCDELAGQAARLNAAYIDTGYLPHGEHP